MTKTQTFSAAAIETARQELLSRSRKPIVSRPDFDILPSPKFEGEQLSHPVSLKRYVAIRSRDNCLVWNEEARVFYVYD